MARIWTNKLQGLWSLFDLQNALKLEPQGSPPQTPPRTCACAHPRTNPNGKEKKRTQQQWHMMKKEKTHYFWSSFESIKSSCSELFLDISTQSLVFSLGHAFFVYNWFYVALEEFIFSGLHLLVSLLFTSIIFSPLLERA